MKANKGQAGRLETILNAAPRCGLLLDICPDSFGYRADGRARRMNENVSFSSARDAVQIHYGNAIEGRRGKITLRPGHECFTVAAVLAGILPAADALKSIRELLRKTADVKSWRPELDKAVCIIRNASATGLADEIRLLLAELDNCRAYFGETLPKSLANHFEKISGWLSELSALAADERPETILTDKEQEETTMKTYAVYFTDAPEQAMICRAENKKAAEKAGRLYRRQWNIAGKIDRIELRETAPADPAPVQDPAPAAVALAADERPETILTDKEQEETTMKTAAETVQETTAETVALSPEELAEFHAQWEADRLAETRPEWRPHVTAIMAAFPAVYSRLYDADCPDRDGDTIDYSAETALFDAWMKAPVWKEFISACAAYRGDCFSSDREAAAFVIACRETREARKAFTAREAETSAPAADETETAPAADERPETISAARAPEKPARGPAKEKDFAGESISGKGWSIVFDTGLNRTRVIVADPLRDKLSPMIENAGFYFSKAQNSWNKKLTHRAHRAALALADEIRTALAS